MKQRGMKMYMSGITFYRTLAEAEAAFKPADEFRKLEKHQDGSAAIVTLQYKPVQPGQAKYQG